MNMKKIAAVSVLSLLTFTSCEMLGDGSSGEEGELEITFSGPASEDDTRVSSELPDTNDFLLYVAGAEGDVLYEGSYGEVPDPLILKPGSYNVRTLSREFVKPAFSSPQYGDEQCVLVEPGAKASVRLLCVQMNSGVRLNTSSDFLKAYPGASLVLKSKEGSLMYSYSEKRIAYFKPGNISLALSKGGTDEILMTRWLEPGEILSLGVGVSGSADSSAGKEISIAVDTSRVWIEDQLVIGGQDSTGTEAEDAMGINQAMSSVGKEGVWVRGYAVGGDLSSTSGSFEVPFSSRTNMILGPKPSATDRSSCLAVQLPVGSVRDALNLVDNPEIKGRKLILKGDIVASYFGLVGIKNVTDYVLE